MAETGLHSADEYANALRRLRTAIRPNAFAMLRALYLAPDATATALELALAAGQSGYRATNSILGALGSQLREAMQAPRDADSQQSAILASFIPPDETHEHWRWVMHPALAAALNDLGWFDEQGLPEFDLEDQPPAAIEGEIRRAWRNHRRREHMLRSAKIRAAIDSAPDRRLRCEVPGCQFDFVHRYGELGEGFAEVHHLRPLSEMQAPETVTLDDLAVLCANCHRMIHRGGRILSLEELGMHLRA